MPILRLIVCLCLIPVASADEALQLLRDLPVPPAELEKALSKAGVAEVKIVPMNSIGALMLKGDQQSIFRARRVIEMMAPKQQAIQFTVRISVFRPDVDRPVATDEFSLTTLNQRSVTARVAHQVSVVKAVQSIRGTQVKQKEVQQVGTSVEMTPEMSGGRVLTNIAVEKAWIEVEDESMQSDTFTATAETSIVLEPGKPQTLVLSAGSGTATRKVVIEISAKTSTDRVQNKAASASTNSAPRRPGSDQVQRSQPTPQRPTLRNGGPVNDLRLQRMKEVEAALDAFESERKSKSLKRRN